MGLKRTITRKRSKKRFRFWPKCVTIYGHMVEMSPEESPFAAALLRVALAMRTDPTHDFERAVRQTAARMQLDPSELRNYLALNMRALATASVGKRGAK